MTFAPKSLLDARSFLLSKLGGGTDKLTPAEVGVVGDAAHWGGYHCGKDRVISGDYSVVESPRDKKGLSGAASALDVGLFSITVGGKTHTLKTFSVWVVEQCKKGTSDTRDIREVIYSPDGKTVKRWDRLGVRSSGDDSHLWHTHISYFRDSENRDKTALFRRWWDQEVNGSMPTVKDFWTGSAADLIQRYTDDGKAITDPKANPFMTAGFALGWAVRESTLAKRTAEDVRKRVDALTAKVDAVLTAQPAPGAPVPVTVDAAELAAALLNDPAFVEGFGRAFAAEVAKRMES